MKHRLMFLWGWIIASPDLTFILVGVNLLSGVVAFVLEMYPYALLELVICIWLFRESRVRQARLILGISERMIARALMGVTTNEHIHTGPMPGDSGEAAMRQARSEDGA